jgi:hypothetical protein
VADSEDMPPTGPLDDTGETGRNRTPADESENGRGDFTAHDDPDHPNGFFAELEHHNRGEEIVPKAEPEDFGFDEISQDEPQEPAAAEQGAGGTGAGRSSRTGRMRAAGGRRRSGGSSSRPPRTGAAESPFANPRVRLLLGIVVVVVVVAVIVLIVRDYERNRLVDGYTSYVTNSAQVAQASAALGTNVVHTMQNTSGQSTAQLQADLKALATEAGHQTAKAQQLDVPSGAVDANRALVLALRYRQDGLQALSTNLQTIVHSNSDTAAAQSIAGAMQQFLASDVIVQDSYLTETAQALRNESITGVSVPSTSSVTFLPGANQNYVLASGAARLLGPLRHVGPESSGQGAPVGLSLVSVVAEPNSITLTPGIAVTIPESSNLHWAVTVQNGGSYVENNIKVSGSVSYGTTPVDVQTNTIATINPGQQVLISVPGPQASAVKLGTLGLLHIQVATVPGEQNVANNAADYPITVTFS